MNKKKKEYGGIILNPGCTNSCVFCGLPRGRKTTVPYVEIKRQVIASCKNLKDFERQGIENITISGSDPLEYEEIIQMIEYIKESNFKFIEIATNGVRLANESFLDRFIKSGINRIRVPLYGSNAKIHDSVTQTPGSFASTIKGIKGIIKKSKNIEIQITSLILKQNKENLLDLIDLVREKLNKKNINFSVPCIPKDNFSYYIPFKDLGSYVKKIYDYTLKKSHWVSFSEIPYCVFGYIDKQRIDNLCLPPNLGKYCQPPLTFRTPIKDTPSYRLKRKIKMCKDCKASSFCGGFFINDIDKFGPGNLKPILK
jgi:MoaA/NifB/PqqE/SkfB family radical SAM enzyme